MKNNRINEVEVKCICNMDQSLNEGLDFLDVLIQNYFRTSKIVL